MEQLVYVLVALSLPWLWGAILSTVFTWRERRQQRRDLPATDYRI